MIPRKFSRVPIANSGMGRFDVKYRLYGITAAAVLLGCAMLILAQQVAPTANTAAKAKWLASSGVYTEAQAARGKALYSRSCLQCHGGELSGAEGSPPLAGSLFLSHWGGLSIGALHARIEKTMPPGNSGSLGAVSDADVVAYILSKNGFPPGSKPLPADPAGLSAIALDTSAPTASAQLSAIIPQTAPVSGTTSPPPGLYSKTAPKLRDNAAAAALFNGVRTAGDPGPDPSRPAGGNTTTVHAVESFVPVSDAMLRKPDPSDWMMMRGNYQGWGYSTLDQINKNNVKGLQLVWARLMEDGINESTPLVYKGVMYLGNSNDVIQAIDAVSGELLWQYRRRLPSIEELHNNVWGNRKRSIFLYDNKIYTTTRDNFLIAVDAKNGKELWQVNRGGDLYVSNSTGPVVINGIVLAGSSCQEAPFGCYVDAHDAQTGKLLWRNEVIPHPGDPGDETWGGKPFNERWETGVWGPITYDPDTNIAYYGSTGIGPASEAQRNQIGATLAGTNTRFAVDPATGKILWKHQTLPEDNWDQECTFEMIPITTAVHPDPNATGMFSVGRGANSASRKTLTGIPCKTAIMWSFDAVKGTYLWSKSTVLQNLVKKIDDTGAVTVNPDMLIRDENKTYHICPAYSGGRNWTFSAYSPQTNVMYIPLFNNCSDQKVRIDNVPSLPYTDYNMATTQMLAEGKTNLGRIDAISVETGKTLWSWETPAVNYSPILATASGLLFNGGMDRYFRAFDQANGKLLWQTRLGSQVQGAPITFNVNGRQYIAVVAGGGYMGAGVRELPNIDQPPGANMVYVFALPE
jgi:alcohol dehydrogenase (cytochrome c)